jgi:hypothetical protein
VLPGGSIVMENGQLQTIFSSTFTVGAFSLPVAVRVQSDLEAVPEPGTLLLISSGLLGVGAAARWRMRRR